LTEWTVLFTTDEQVFIANIHKEMLANIILKYLVQLTSTKNSKLSQVIKNQYYSLEFDELILVVCSVFAHRPSNKKIHGVYLRRITLEILEF
jgi:hypothetical protein